MALENERPGQGALQLIFQVLRRPDERPVDSRRSLVQDLRALLQIAGAVWPHVRSIPMRRQAEHAAEGAARCSFPGLDAGTRHPAGREDLDPVTDRKKKTEVLGKRFCIFGPESAGDRRWVAQDDTKGEPHSLALMVSTKATQQRQPHPSMIRVACETAHLCA